MRSSIFILLFALIFFSSCKKDYIEAPDLKGVWRGAFTDSQIGSYKPIMFRIKDNNVIELYTSLTCSFNSPEITGTWKLDIASFTAKFVYPTGEIKEIHAFADSDGKGLKNPYMTSSLSQGNARLFQIAKD